MNRIFLGFLASSLLFSAGCATKKYARNEVTPVVNKVNELDDLTAKNTHDIKDVDTRTQQGIQQVQSKTAEVETKTQAAASQAQQAQQLADQATTRVTSLTNTVANLDNYRVVVDTSVHFGFNKDNLTSKAKTALDELAVERLRPMDAEIHVALHADEQRAVRRGRAIPCARPSARDLDVL